MIIGLDYASVDGNLPPDFVKARAAGAEFIYMRAYQQLISKDLPDPHYARDAENARKAGLVVGAYLFPSYNVRAVSPRDQVARFKKAVANGKVVIDKDLPPALDVEVKDCDWKATGRTQRELVAVTEQFVREMQNAFGVNPVIYTSYHQWWGLGYPVPAWAVECPLWIKTAYRLAAKTPVDQVMPRDPHVGYDRLKDPRNNHRVPDAWAKSGWFFQQFQGDAIGFPGFSKTFDVNRFNVARRGTNAPHVGWMQRRLNKKLATASSLVEDGDFARKTEAALVQFQTSRGLPSTGELDVRTFASLAW